MDKDGDAPEMMSVVVNSVEGHGLLLDSEVLMARQITLELSDNLYARAQEIAVQQNQNVAEVITEILNDALASQEQPADYLEADTNSHH
jgi:hypothetical protein